ncbi:pectinesterase family protein [uncultured Arcticibacterium sp.]|uniref:pectinesterase family protein n=1 Tax=uncultured Arcticibacterium sp. TaxID=2173042 RepID=UPI0030F8AF38
MASKVTLLFSILFILCFQSFAKKIIVAQDGTGDYVSIQEAIDAVVSSSKMQTIFIKNGTYKEKLLIDSTKHHLRLLGESTKGVIVTYSQSRDYWRCENDDDFGAATINVLGHDLIFENLTVLNTYGFDVEGSVSIDCLNESGKANSAKKNYLPREKGEPIGQKIVRKDGHQFSFRSLNGATRIKFLSCVFRSGGGDTVSPWDVGGGMFYFNDCIIEGHVDLYCPRGNALIENSLIICHNMTAGIWHDGSGNESDKSVLINCRFEGDPGFKLGRYHKEAQMYLINCSFSEEMADAEIYQSTKTELKWGHRIYYKNCHKDQGDYAWHQDNTDLTEKDFKFKKIFGKKW